MPKYNNHVQQGANEASPPACSIILLHFDTPTPVTSPGSLSSVVPCVPPAACEISALSSGESA